MYHVYITLMMLLKKFYMKNTNEKSWITTLIQKSSHFKNLKALMQIKSTSNQLHFTTDCQITEINIFKQKIVKLGTWLVFLWLLTFNNLYQILHLIQPLKCHCGLYCDGKLIHKIPILIISLPPPLDQRERWEIVKFMHQILEPHCT